MCQVCFSLSQFSARPPATKLRVGHDQICIDQLPNRKPTLENRDELCATKIDTKSIRLHMIRHICMTKLLLYRKMSINSTLEFSQKIGHFVYEIWSCRLVGHFFAPNSLAEDAKRHSPEVLQEKSTGRKGDL